MIGQKKQNKAILNIITDYQKFSLESHRMTDIVKKQI